MILIMIVLTIIGILTAILYFMNNTFRLPVTNPSRFCKCAIPWMLPLRDILFEYGIEHVTFGLSCLHSLLEYSTGELQALQLIVLTVFGAVD